MYNRGNTLLACGGWMTRLPAMNGHCSSSHAYAAALNGRGNVLHHLGRLDEAIASYDAALAASPAWWMR